MKELTGWMRAIDEALVVHDIGVANEDDSYEVAKDKLNKLLCVVQDIGAYFATHLKEIDVKDIKNE